MSPTTQSTHRQRLRSDLDRLLGVRSPLCLSIYHDAKPHAGDLDRQHIALKNAISAAKNQLEEVEQDSEKVQPLVRQLEQQLAELAQLAQRSEGLAVFCSPDSMDVYPTPFAVESNVSVGPRFSLRPLIGALGLPHRFYVLALSRNDARLVLADDEVQQVVSFDKDVPQSLEESTPTLREDQLQMHSGSSAAEPNFHGQRPSERREDEDLKRYLGRVADEVERLVRPPGAPIVLAGLSELTSQFRDGVRLNLVEDEVSGSPDELTPKELVSRARDCARPALDSAAKNASQRAEELVASDLFVDDLDGVLRAAHDGRIATLLLRQGSIVYGNYDLNERTSHFSATPDDGSTDLLNLAAVQSFEHGADIFVVPDDWMPSSPKPAAAILRY